MCLGNLAKVLRSFQFLTVSDLFAVNHLKLETLIYLQCVKFPSYTLGHRNCQVITIEICLSLYEFLLWLWINENAEISGSWLNVDPQKKLSKQSQLMIIMSGAATTAAREPKENKGWAIFKYRDSRCGFLACIENVSMQKTFAPVSTRKWSIIREPLNGQGEGGFRRVLEIKTKRRF